MNNFFDNTGKPRILIDSSSLLKPPPVAICPHTAARLQVQYLLPSGEAVFVEVQRRFAHYSHNIGKQLLMPFHSVLAPLLASYHLEMNQFYLDRLYMWQHGQLCYSSRHSAVLD